LPWKDRTRCQRRELARAGADAQGAGPSRLAEDLAAVGWLPDELATPNPDAARKRHEA
jgi:hypothetical protein